MKNTREVFINKTDVIEFYDKIAVSYDEQLKIGYLEKIIRKCFQAKLLDHLKPGDHVLELGCGTGTDAIFLAKNGIYVSALDISSSMINIAKQKIDNEKLGNFVKVFLHDAQNIKELMNESFQCVISNFNGLNYIDLIEFSKTLPKKMKYGKNLIITLLNKRCIWEFWYYIFKLKPKKAFENLKKRDKNYIVEMNLFSPSEINKIFSKYFKIKKFTGFGFLIPPDGFSGLQRKLSSLFKIFEKADIFLASRYPFKYFCDHYIIELERNEKIVKNYD